MRMASGPTQSRRRSPGGGCGRKGHGGSGIARIRLTCDRWTGRWPGLRFSLRVKFLYGEYTTPLISYLRVVFRRRRSLSCPPAPTHARPPRPARRRTRRHTARARLSIYYYVSDMTLCGDPRSSIGATALPPHTADRTTHTRTPSSPPRPPPRPPPRRPGHSPG